MSETTIRVLLIEDNLGDARLIRKALADAIQADPDIPNFDIVRAAKLSTGLKRLAKGDVDVVLLDLSLPDSQGLETFTTAHASAPEIPIIVLSELEDKSLAVEAVRGGAQDYLVKGEADGSLLARAMRHAVEYKQMETTLRDSQAELAAIFENAPLMMLIVDHERRVQRVNGAAIHFADRPAEEMIGRRGGEALRCLHALDDPRGCGFGPSCETCVVRRTVMDTIEGDVRHTNVQAGLTIAGEEGAKDLALLVSTVPLAIAGKPRVLVCIEDVTERKWAEDETRILAEMVDASPASITVHDYDGNFVYANQKTLDLHGYTRDEFLALNLRQLDVPESARLIAPRMQKLGERGEASWEVTHYRKDGTTIPLRVHAKAARWGGQEVILSIATDITERKRADAALRESEQKYRFITEKMTDTVWLIDMEFKPTFISPSATHTLGYTLEELQVLPLDKLLTPESFEFAMKTVAAELSPERLAPRPYERSVTVELEFRRKDGFPLWSESTITMLRDSEGHPTGFMGVGRDITERKRAEEALRFTQFAVDRAADPVFWMGSDARLTYVNDTACRRLGYSREELLTKTVHDIDPNFPQEIWENHWREVKTRGSFTLESLHRTKDGQVFPVEIAVNFLEFEGKEYNCAFARDIAERKQAEQEREHLLAQVQEQARRVQQIIDTVPEGVILLDTKSRVVLANPLGRKDLAILADTLVGGTLVQLGSHPLVELLTSPPEGLWHEVSAEGQTFQVIARPVSEAAETGPTPGGWVLVIRDVTQQHEIERRIQQQERLAAVGQLAVGIAHDFNNIMAVITLYAGMSLRTSDLPPKVCERLEIIDQQARRASGLIQQIMDFSRRAVLERGPVDMLVFLKEQIKLLQRTLPENIKVEMTYGQNEHTVHADPTRIQQAVMNLATNARDAMPQGGQLHIALDRVQIKESDTPPLPGMKPGDWVCVHVADTGTGIPDDVLPHIYDPFFTTKEPGKGTGLGLAQVYGIIKQHEGYIDVRTKVGEGTTFILYLPALALEQPETPQASKEHLILGEGQVILVVEDDAATRSAVVSSLELLGYQVLEATNGREALTVFEAHAGQIALVLSDMIMPEMGGQALFHALRQRDPAVKMLLLTGHPLEEEGLESLQAQGLRGWLLKPPSLEKLAEVVARTLRVEESPASER